MPVVDAINLLHLPRYGLGNMSPRHPHKAPTPNEAKQLEDLSRAGKRAHGVSAAPTLFKRLESSGEALSSNRSIAMCCAISFSCTPSRTIFLCRLAHRMPGFWTPPTTTKMSMIRAPTPNCLIDAEDEDAAGAEKPRPARRGTRFRASAAETYRLLRRRVQEALPVAAARIFVRRAAQEGSARPTPRLLKILDDCGRMGSRAKDTKLAALIELLTKTHPKDKVIVFTQFADTVRYLGAAA